MNEIFFKSKDPEYGWLSNFSEHGFTLDDLPWSSVEHYYQAQKYLDPNVREQIRATETPRKARKAGQNRSLVPRDDWDSIKVEVMRRALHAKFSQNSNLKRRLVETGAADLVHESSTDRFWGRSLDGAGVNILGQLLMELRIELT